MTPIQAREKWCAHTASFPHPHGSETNLAAISGHSGHCKCIVQDCMGWRWNKTKTLGYCGYAGPDKN